MRIRAHQVSCSLLPNCRVRYGTRIVVLVLDYAVFMQFSALNSANNDNVLKTYLLYGFRPGKSESAIRFGKLFTVFPQK